VLIDEHIVLASEDAINSLNINDLFHKKKLLLTQDRRMQAAETKKPTF